MAVRGVNPVDFDMDSALTGLVASVAMQEAAIANLINMETRKLQFVCCMEYDSDEEKAETLLRVNESIAKTIDIASCIEKNMARKLIMALEAYGKP